MHANHLAQPVPRMSCIAKPPRRVPSTKLIVVSLGTLVLLALAACGGSFTVRPGYTPTLAGATPTEGAQFTATPGPTRFAYLYSRIDYPLEVAISSGDTVTLTLSPRSSILTVTPAPGQGTGTVGTPIPLPTDTQDYQDIAASVDTQTTDTGAFTWALVSPGRQSLLTAGTIGTARDYMDSVVFKWHVQAVSEGQNTARIVLHLIYVYLDGSEHDGSIEVSQAPIPMVAVQASTLSIALAQIRLPIVGVSGFAGIIALLRYIYNALKTVSDMTGQVKGAVKVAQAVKGRVGGSPSGQDLASQSTASPVARSPQKIAPGRSPTQSPTIPEHAGDATWPARRGSVIPHWPERPWPPLPSDPS